MWDVASLYAMVGRPAGRVLARGVAVLRRGGGRAAGAGAVGRGGRGTRADGAARCRRSARAGSPARGSISPRTCCDTRTTATRWSSGTSVDASGRLSRRQLRRRGGGRRGRRWPRSGVGAGDRVAGFLPNLPETVIAMLAAASLGAVWSSCSPDFGANGVLDRFGQIRPKVLVCADGYRYAGKTIDSLAAGAGGARAAARASSASSSSPTSSRGPTSARLPGARALGRAARRAPGAGPPDATPACRSIIRSTSCTPRAPPGSPSAWCTGPAARCCST